MAAPPRSPAAHYRCGRRYDARMFSKRMLRSLQSAGVKDPGSAFDARPISKLRHPHVGKRLTVVYKAQPNIFADSSLATRESVLGVAQRETLRYSLDLPFAVSNIREMVMLSCRRAYFSTVTLTIFLLCNDAFANTPFGFEVNSHPSKYKFCLPTETKDTYICTSAPKPHGAFENYFLWYVGEFGLCKTVAVGKTIDNDAYGDVVRRRTDKLAQQIEKKYGPPTDKFDFLHSGSIWDEPRDWMLSLSRNERSYVYAWSSDMGYIPIANVKTIMLQAHGHNSRDGYVTVAFEFSNMSRCTNAKNEAESDAF